MTIRTKAALIALAITSTLQANVLRLRNGTTYRGRYAGGTAQIIRFEDENGRVQRVNRDDVRGLFFGNEDSSFNQDPPPASGGYRQDRNYDRDRTPSAANDRTPPSATNDAYRRDDRYRDTADRDRNYRGSDVTIPSGTRVTIRMIDPVDSDRNSVGQTFRASIDDPVVVNGQTVIPAGSDASVRVVDIRQGGRISGSEEISLELSQISVNGRNYPVYTEYAQSASKARGKQSAQVIGGTAVVGAIIGAIAGGGQGAAIGAASGAAAGTGIQAVRGQRVRVESEARLDFTLSQPLSLR